MPKRQRIAPTDNWQQLELRFTSPEQRTYELIRPVVLFGQAPAARALETGTAQRTIYRRVQRFEAEGMASLFVEPIPTLTRTLPPHLRHLIVTLKAEHAGLRVHEIATICYARTGRRPSPHTVKRVLAEEPPLLRVQRRFLPFHDTPDPAERRKAILRLHMEGWNAKSIAGYLGTSRETVHATLRRWIADGVQGLVKQPRARRFGSPKVTLHVMHRIRRMQQNPGLGEWRVHAALRADGIRISPRTVGRILALNRTLYQLPRPKHAPREPQVMPFRAVRRHQFWTVDVRYLDTPALDGGQVYCISILENYSRAILASAVSHTQDLTAFLIVLYAAVRQHGTPEALVSDGGSVFRANQALQIYAALGITKEQIAKRQAWQSYIETNFNVQRRMADYHFAQATTWSEVQAVHDRWVADFNFKRIGRIASATTGGIVLPKCSAGCMAGCTRPPTCTAPSTPRALAAGWTGTGMSASAIGACTANLAYRVRLPSCGSTAKRSPSRFTIRRWRSTACRLHPDLRQFRTVDEPRVFATPYHATQLPLWDTVEHEWLKVFRVPRRPRVHRPTIAVVQERLFA